MAAVTSDVLGGGASLGGPILGATAIRCADQLAALAAIGLVLAATTLPDETKQSGTTSPAPVSTALYPGKETDFGAYLGAPYHYPSDFHLKNGTKTDLTLKEIEWFTHPFENPLYYGVRLQRWFEGGRVGGMIDFTHSKAYAPMDKDTEFQGTIDGKPAPATAKVRSYFDKLEWSHGHNMLTLNGLLRLPSLGIVSPYAGVGAGVLLPHSEIHLRSDPSRTYEYQYAGPVGQLVFGLEFRLAKGSVFLEYKFTLADYWNPLSGRDGSYLPIDLWHQFSRWWSGAEPRDGWAGARVTSHQVVGGFLTRFVPKPAT